MSYGFSSGSPIHGEFTSADASALTEANARILLYGASSTTAITLASTDIVCITDLTIVAGAALTVTIYDGANNSVAAGERIMLGNFAANGGMTESYSTPFFCQTGTWPKVLTSGAGQIDVNIRGYIVRKGA